MKKLNGGHLPRLSILILFFGGVGCGVGGLVRGGWGCEFGLAIILTGHFPIIFIA